MIASAEHGAVILREGGSRMFNEKNKKNNMPWEGEPKRFNLRKPIQLGLVCAMASLVVFTAYHATTKDMPAEPGVPGVKDITQSTGYIGNAIAGAGKNVEDGLGAVGVFDEQYELRVNFVDENGDKLIPSAPTWYRAGEFYCFPAEAITGYVASQNWYEGEMPNHDVSIQIVYYMKDSVLANGVRPSLELLQVRCVNSVYAEDGSEVALREPLPAKGGANTRYRYLKDVTLPNVAYRDKEQTGYYLEYAGALFLVKENGDVVAVKPRPFAVHGSVGIDSKTGEYVNLATEMPQTEPVDAGF